MSNTGSRQHAPNKAERAKFGKDTINNVIPRILEHNQRAKTGCQNVQKYRSSEIPHASQVSMQPDSTYTPPTVRVINADTFDAARKLLQVHANDKVAVLNMCSTMQPGGGVLRGAKAQEESLCLRSTLYPSLHDQFYRMQEDALIYTPDVYIFRDSAHQTLSATDSYYVDVISCPALRKPQVEHDRYVHQRDEEVMQQKIRMIMRIAVEKGVKRLVLGALGCGAYGNPNKVVANLFKRVIFGNPRRREEQEGWEGLQEIVFAIYGADNDNLSVFKEVFEGSEGPVALGEGA